MCSVRSLLQLILVSCFVALQAQRISFYSTIPIANAPYIIQLRDENGKFFCAGTLISCKFVLTAAECFNEIDYTKAVVVAGTESLTKEGVQRKIAKVTIHPEYSIETKHPNLAVLKLHEPLQDGSNGTDDIGTLPVCERCLNSFDDQPHEVIAIGWRHMYSTNPSENILATTGILLGSDKRCHKDFPAGPEQGVFCAVGRNYDDQFSVSDLGGPAVCECKLCGVATSCHKCDDTNYSNRFVDLYPFRDFINEAMV